VSAPRIAELLDRSQVVVCCGAGGVGKTTTSTALALAAARRGRRVLALTVDPSKRLADTLGVAQNLDHPVAPPPDRLAEAGIRAPGSLEAWMLDPKRVTDRVVAAFAKTPEDAARLAGNRVYGQVSRMVSGMQEYTAMEALHGFLRDGRYDLVVLDTPPSRHALDFLEGPGKLAEFLEGRVFQLFLPDPDANLLAKGAAKVLGKALGAALGDDNYRELQEFFASFSGIFRHAGANAKTMRASLSDPARAAFLLVTSPASAALTEVHYFRQKAIEMQLPFRGYLLNRSQARPDARAMPDPALLGAAPDETLRRAWGKLARLAEVERAEVARDRALLGELRTGAGEEAFAVALPTLPGGAHEMRSLLALADVLVES
jgi:anion-transporting  ArsA/GET3 family ATPase